MQPLHEIKGLQVEYASTKAILVKTDEGDEYWVPRSQIMPGGTLGDDPKKGDQGSLIIPEWLAVKKGITTPGGES